jgi:hypothetical protein
MWTAVAVSTWSIRHPGLFRITLGFLRVAVIRATEGRRTTSGRRVTAVLKHTTQHWGEAMAELLILEFPEVGLDKYQTPEA